MANALKNEHANMEIGWCMVSNKKMLYVQEGNLRRYYGTLIDGKANRFLDELRKWDEAGGSDSDEI